jgi:hypothetical protein
MKTMASLVHFAARNLLAAFLIVQASASAATWTGIQSSDWYDYRNWSPASVPGAGADVVMNGGYATVSGGNLSLNTLTVNGGVIANIATLNAQVITVAGSVSTTSITTQTLNLNGGTVGGSIQMTTGGAWNGGTLNGGPIQISAGGSVLIPSGVVRLGDSVQLTNAGTVQMTGGQIEGYQSSIIRNEGTWILNGHGSPFLNYYSSNQFNNLGVLKKTGGTNPTVLESAWTFNLNAETRCDSGELRFGTTTNLPTGATLTGAGTIRSVSTLNLTGTAVETVGNLILDGGTLVGTGSAAVTGTVEWASGGIAGNLSVPSGSSMLVTGSGLHRLADSATLHNYGTMTWQAASGIDGYQFSTIHNHAGATFNLAVDGVPFSQYYGGNTFQNDGLFRKTTGAGTAEVNVWTFHQYGTVQCDSGAIEFKGLALLHGGSTVTGSATVRLNGDTRMDGAVHETITNFRMTGGGLLCTDPCSLVGRLDWEAGTISGVLGIPVASVLEVSGPGFKRIADQARITVGGTYRWDGPTGVEGYQNSKITVLAGGLCDLTADGDPFNKYYEGNELVIEGTLKKSAGTGGATVLNDWTYRHHGILDCAVSTLEVASSFVLENSSSITGAGQVLIYGTTYHNGLVNLTAPVSWTGGTWVGDGGTMTGTLTWSGGYSAGSWTVGSGGTLKVVNGTGALKRVNDAALIVVSGAVELQSGTLNGYQNSIVRVLNGGVFRCMGEAVMDQYYGGSRIDIKAGGLLTTQAAGNARIDWAVDNAGSVTTPAGILNCNGGGTSTGLFQSTAPGALYFTAGTHSLGTGAEMRGPGEVKITGGVLTATASVPAFIHVAGGTVQGTGDFGEFQFRDGSQWTSGFVGGHSRILVGATLTVSGTDSSLRRMNDSARLDIDGRLLWQGPGSIQLYQSCQVFVNASGVLELSGDGNVFAYYYGGDTVTSVGTIRRSGSAGDAVLAIASYSSTGRIDVQSGRLLFNSNLGLGNGGLVTGAGRMVIAGGTTSLTGTTTLSSTLLELGGGTLYADPAANGTLAGSSIEWTSGYVGGLVKWTGIARTSGSGFRRINDSSELHNAGVLTLAGGGSIECYQNSILHNLQGATLQATGQVSLSRYYSGNLLLNEGTLVLGASPGRMIVDGAFTQTASGRIEVGVGGPSSVTPQFDILNVYGTATLAGTLVANVEGSYSPPIGTTFEILTGSSRIGTFASVVSPRFAVTYPVSLNDVVLTAHAFTSESYATWASNRGLSGGNAASSADPDYDGLSNWQEYAFNLNPKVGNGQPMSGGVESISGEKWLVMRYRRWSGPVDAGLIYQPEWSRDLVVWSAGGMIDEFDPQATPVSDSEPRRCRVLANEAKKFLHMNLAP